VTSPQFFLLQNFIKPALSYGEVIGIHNIGGFTQTGAVRLVRRSSRRNEGGGVQAKWNELY